ARVAPLDQQRQPPAVIDMGVGQHHRVDLVDVEGERPGIAGAFVVAALYHAALDQHLGAVGPQKVAGAGYFADRPEEFDCRHLTRELKMPKAAVCSSNRSRASAPGNPRDSVHGPDHTSSQPSIDGRSWIG